MTDAKINYWRECIEIGASECGLSLTPEQVLALAYAVESGHDNYGQAFYSPPAGERAAMEHDRLKRELATEREKVTCPRCRGRGWITENFLNRSSTSQCDKCGGDGRLSPSQL